jgi:hypothetical protein
MVVEEEQEIYDILIDEDDCFEYNDGKLIYHQDDYKADCTVEQVI